MPRSSQSGRSSGCTPIPALHRMTSGLATSQPKYALGESHRARSELAALGVVRHTVFPGSTLPLPSLFLPLDELPDRLLRCTNLTEAESRTGPSSNRGSVAKRRVARVMNQRRLPWIGLSITMTVAPTAAKYKGRRSRNSFRSHRPAGVRPAPHFTPLIDELRRRTHRLFAWTATSIASRARTK